MNHSNRERGSRDSETVSSDLPGLKILPSGTVLMHGPSAGETPAAHCVELPPVHPKCRVFCFEDLQAYADKLKAANNSTGMINLREALVKVLNQPVQGKWFEVAYGLVGTCRIINWQRARFMGDPVEWQRTLKAAFCSCAKCLAKRRVN